MTKPAIYTGIIFATCILGAAGFWQSKSNYDNCILNGMQGVSSNIAATSITKACRSKYPEKTIPLNDFALSASQISKLNLTGRILESLGHPFFGDLYNGNLDVKITSITVQINNSEQHKYLTETQVDPLTTRPVHFDVHGLNGLNTHSVISARGVSVKAH